MIVIKDLMRISSFQSLKSLRLFSTDELKTVLYDLHIEKGGKMVPFAGYQLPVQFEGLGVLKEHLHTRSASSASVFDVSHMGQIKWRGKDAVKFLEKLVVGDIASLKEGEAKLSLIMKDTGCIVDDTVITNAGDHIFMVVNGACKHKDMDHFKFYLTGSGMDVHMEYQEDQQLIALQGPGASTVMSQLASGLNYSTMPFMSSAITTVAGIKGCRVTRCGYTGEDGFEISVMPGHTIQLAEALLAAPGVLPAGLGARDSLRLEAGLCLYGNDIDETTTPSEAALVWTIGGPKSRRRIQQGFLGAEKFLEPDGKLKPITRKRVGIAGMKVPARAHVEIFSEDGHTRVGEITSGGFGPSVGKPVAMGYVSVSHSVEGTPVLLSIRGKLVPAQITSMPFIPTNYFRPNVTK